LVSLATVPVPQKTVANSDGEMRKVSIIGLSRHENLSIKQTM